MGKYEIAKQVEQEDTLNTIECLGYDTSRLSNDELEVINDELQNALANDDDYEIMFSAKLTTDDVKAMNGCFFSAMWEEMGIECYNLEIEKE